MSTPTANNHSWYNTKNDGPGQQRVTHNTHLYNRTMPHHAGPSSDQSWQHTHQPQQTQYWYTPVSKPPLNAAHQMNSGSGVGDSWNWPRETNYQQSQQQSTPQYPPPTYGSSEVPAVTRPNPDPWNWGWDESGISANPEPVNNNNSSGSSNNNNNACTDPTWGWSVDGTTYQDHNVKTNASYPSGQEQNYTVPTSGTAFNTGQSNTAAVIAESFSATSIETQSVFGINQGSYFQTPQSNISSHFDSSFQNDRNKSPFSTHYPASQLSVDNIGSVSQYTTVNPSPVFNQDIHNQGSHGAENEFKQGFASNTCQQQTLDPYIGSELKNIENVNPGSFQSSVDCANKNELANIPLHVNDYRTSKDGKENDLSMSPIASDTPVQSEKESSSREHDVSKQSCSTGNDGLSSQWSTESLPSSEELSQTLDANGQTEEVSNHSTISHSPFTMETSQVNQQQSLSFDSYHQTYDYNFNNDLQNSRSTTERKDEAQFVTSIAPNTALEESHSSYSQGYQGYYSDSYGAAQVPDVNVMEQRHVANTGFIQEGTNSHNDQIDVCNKNVLGHNLCTMQTESVSVTQVPSDVNTSVEGIASSLETLSVSDTGNLRSPDVENKEIVCPESDQNVGASLPSQGHGNSHVSTVSPPKTVGVVQGRNSNTYSLNQNHGTMFLTNPPSGEVAAGRGERKGYNTPAPSEPVMSVAQFGALPEIMSSTINNLMQPSFNYTNVETPGQFNRKKKSPADDAVNLETVPDNKERPDFIDVPQTALNEKQTVSPMTRLHAAPVGQDAVQSSTSQWNQLSNYSTSPENQEVAPHCGPDRNQYLETGQLTSDERDMRSMPDVVETLQYRSSRNGNPNVHGLQRMVPGQIMGQDLNTNYEPENAVSIHSGNNFNEDVSTPPPGLHRMIPGQFTENENSAAQNLDESLSTENASDDVLLHRMVPGQMTEDSGSANFIPEGGNAGAAPLLSSVDDIPPPGLRRMVPGESSSPESQGNSSVMLAQSGLPAGTFQPIDAVPLEPRVVTGVAQDEMDGVGTAAALQLSPSPLLTNSRVKSEPVSPSPDQTAINNLPQPPSERSETIGSDSVEAYPPPPPPENTVRDTSGSRRDNVTKDRERRHPDEENSDLNSRHQRRQTDGRDYHNSRDKDRADSPGSSRYRDRDQWDWKYDSRQYRDRDRARDRDDSSSGGRYGDDADRHDNRKDYRGQDDSRRSRHKTGFDKQEDDADIEDYYSDEHEKSRYRDNYDSRYRSRGDRERGQHEGMERSPRDRQDHRVTGRDRERERDRDRDDRVRDRDRGRRRDYSDRHDYRRSDEYYNKSYEDDSYYRDNQRSRPSSRTDYEDYRRRDYHGYGAYNYYGRQMEQYHYDPYYSYKYYENLRRTNPAAYAEWYAKYYASHSSYNQSAFSEDRGSVHSGRSSANEELHKEQDVEQTDSSIVEEISASTPQRLTPTKFSTAHIKGVLTVRGQLIKVLPHYPLDGQPATVEIHDIQGLINSDESVKELQDFPGPLVRGATHKNSVITFCTRKLKKAERDPDLFDRESVILLWKLLILLLRQNGTVVGADIAELLLSNSSTPDVTSFSSISNIRQSAQSPPSSHHGSVHDVQVDEPNLNQTSSKTEDDVTAEFREYLLYGNKKEGLEWAMKHGLWGHALFLASKMDQRTYANVMMRFANGLAMNDPLQTLYQLMSGRQPAAVTCCADEKWGDWKPHLAMILSNPSQRPDLDHKAVITLGDTLGARGCLHASHFCYLMAQLEFGVFSHKSSKFVLLGSSHVKPFLEFATNEAIQMTEIYIYACQLAEHEFNVPQFQGFKYLYAKRLAELGMPAEAIHYVEVIAGAILQRPTCYTASFVKEVYELGDRLKYHDPLYSSGETEGVPVSDPTWLCGLSNVIHNYNIGILQQDIPSYGSTSNLSCSDGDIMQHGVPTTESMQDHLASGTSWQHQQQQHQPPYYSDQSVQQWTAQQLKQEVEGTSDNVCQQPDPSSDLGNVGNNIQSQDQYWANSQWSAGTTGTTDVLPSMQEGGGHQLQSTGNSYNNVPGSENTISGNTPSQQAFNYWDVSAGHTEDVPRVTLPGSTSEVTSQQQSAVQQPKPTLGTKVPAKSKQKEQSSQSAGSSRSWWIGGIWDKLALRPRNQMKLPDDKNPSIVWDPDKKRWTNVDGDDDEGGGDLPPPPKASELPPSSEIHSTASNEGLSSKPLSGSNMYKMNGPGKARKPKYVDVLGGSKTTTTPSIPAPDLFPVMASQPSTNYFIPAPAENSNSAPTDFLTSASSEQTAEQSHEASAYAAPMMFDPASFTQKTVIGKTSTLKRYPN